MWAKQVSGPLILGKLWKLEHKASGQLPPHTPGIVFESLPLYSMILASSSQVAAAKAEAGHNRRHFKAATLELSEVKKELQAKEQEVQRLQAEADGLQ